MSTNIHISKCSISPSIPYFLYPLNESTARLTGGLATAKGEKESYNCRVKFSYSATKQLLRVCLYQIQELIKELYGTGREGV